MLVWADERHFSIGSTEFAMFTATDWPDPGDGLLIGKTVDMIDTYQRIVYELRPERIVEVGVFQGGSTVLLAELAKPAKLVGIDKQPSSRMHRARTVLEPRFGDAVKLYGGVNQADRDRLREIVDEEFGDEPLDLVIDDASHLLAPTTATFETLFPRLREGGVYVIEDWAWAHLGTLTEQLPETYDDRPSLAGLVLDLVLASSQLDDRVRSVTTGMMAQVVRGADPLPEPFTLESILPDKRGLRRWARDVSRQASAAGQPAP